MGWKSVIRDGFLGDKKKLLTYQTLHCPFSVTCPSHIPFKNAHKPKIRRVERISPYVYMYKCMYCGCKFNYDVADPERVHQSELPFAVNPSFIFRKN